MIPDGTTITGGGFASFVVVHNTDGTANSATPGHFGLGAADSARVYVTTGGTDTLVDHVDWTAHAAGTYSRCTFATASSVDYSAFLDTASGTRDAINATCPSAAAAATAVKAQIKVNEVLADNANGTDGRKGSDWIELTNTGKTSIDLGGWWLSDDTAADKDVFPVNTFLAAGALQAFAVGGQASTDSFPGVTYLWGKTKTGTDFGLGAGGDNAAVVIPDGTDADRGAGAPVPTPPPPRPRPEIR